jgi:hypothetical protein
VTIRSAREPSPTLHFLTGMFLTLVAN